MPIRHENTDGINPAYRAYEIDENDRVVKATIIEAASDDSAIDQARRIVASRTVELWDRGRMLVRINAELRPGS